MAAIKYSKASGFTLVEMLVALAVTSLLIGLVYGAVRIGEKSARTLFGHGDRMEALWIGWHYLDNALRHAVPMPPGDDESDRTGFHGTADRLSFVADLPPGAAPGGPSLVTLKMEQESGKTRLAVTQLPLPANADETGYRAILVTKLDSLEISYYDTRDDTSPKWKHEWEDQRYLPRLVRIQVRPTEGPDWPPIVARPLTGYR